MAEEEDRSDLYRFAKEADEQFNETLNLNVTYLYKMCNGLSTGAITAMLFTKSLAPEEPIDLGHLRREIRETIGMFITQFFDATIRAWSPVFTEKNEESTKRQFHEEDERRLVETVFRNVDQDLNQIAESLVASSGFSTPPVTVLGWPFEDEGKE